MQKTAARDSSYKSKRFKVDELLTKFDYQLGNPNFPGAIAPIGLTAQIPGAIAPIGLTAQIPGAIAAINSATPAPNAIPRYAV